MTVPTETPKAFSLTSNWFVADYFMMVFLISKLAYTKKARYSASESHGVLPEILNTGKNLNYSAVNIAIDSEYRLIRA